MSPYLEAGPGSLTPLASRTAQGNAVCACDSSDRRPYFTSPYLRASAIFSQGKKQRQDESGESGDEIKDTKMELYGAGCDRVGGGFIGYKSDGSCAVGQVHGIAIIPKLRVDQGLFSIHTSTMAFDAEVD